MAKVTLITGLVTPFQLSVKFDADELIDPAGTAEAAENDEVPAGTIGFNLGWFQSAACG